DAAIGRVEAREVEAARPVANPDPNSAALPHCPEPHGLGDGEALHFVVADGSGALGAGMEDPQPDPPGFSEEDQRGGCARREALTRKGGGDRRTKFLRRRRPAVEVFIRALLPRPEREQDRGQSTRAKEEKGVA